MAYFMEEKLFQKATFKISAENSGFAKSAPDPQLLPRVRLLRLHVEFAEDVVQPFRFLRSQGTDLMNPLRS
jgi:hypothetical protein